MSRRVNLVPRRRLFIGSLLNAGIIVGAGSALVTWLVIR